MKKVFGLLLAGLAVAIVALGGCGSGTETADDGTTTITVGSMSFEIPADWERPPNYDELMDGAEDTYGSETAKFVDTDYYIAGPDENTLLIVTTMQMDMMSEASGDEWEGWDSMMAEMDFKEIMLDAMIGSFIGDGIENVNEVERDDLVLNGYEASTAEITYMTGGLDTTGRLVIFYTGGDMGVLFLMTDDTDTAGYTTTWTDMKNSVSFSGD